jgi:hypothetical protein
MKNTFLNKVMAERAVLSIVNNYTSGGKQLSGLSWIAIDAWQRANGSVGTNPVINELKEISDLCQRLSDRSHETFEAFDPSLNEGIESRMRSLKQMLCLTTS